MPLISNEASLLWAGSLPLYLGHPSPLSFHAFLEEWRAQRGAPHSYRLQASHATS